jgi:GTP pyrophosphokinase
VIPKPPWRGRKARYIEHIQYASPSIRLVSLSDKLHNARAILLDYRSLGEQVWDRFKGGKEGTLWYYKALVETFRSTPGSPLYLEFEKVVSELLETAHDFQTPP